MAELLKQEERAIFALRELYQKYGYSQFKMSKFESYDLYMQNKDFLVSEGIITFTDTDGTLMALKPDVTLSIVKNFRKDAMPVQKVYYNENVYRMAGAGHTYREIMQTGLECMGDVGLYEICEVILLAAKSLRAISDRFVLDVSHMQIAADLMENLSYEEKTNALQAIADKNEGALADYPQLQELLKISGPIGQALPKLTALCKNQEAIAQLQTICRLLEQNGLADHVQLDFSIVNNRNYYNGIVFRGYVEGIPTGVLAGGQYDQLMKKMNKNAKAIGFAVYLDQLERLDLSRRQFDIDAVIGYTDDADIPALSKAADSLPGSVLLLKQIPDSLRWRQRYDFTEGRLKLLEDHG